jgi:hypothetical protein
LAENNLGALVLPEGWTEGYDFDGDEVYRHTDGREQNDTPGKPEGIIAIANAIPDMGALSSANLLGNQIPVEQAHELVKFMQSKEKLTTLCGFSRDEATLDVSLFRYTQGLGPGDAVLIANDISDMGGILQFTFSGDDYDDPSEAWGPVTMETSMVEAGFSGKGLGISGAIMVAAFLPKCT